MRNLSSPRLKPFAQCTAFLLLCCRGSGGELSLYSKGPVPSLLHNLVRSSSHTWQQLTGSPTPWPLIWFPGLHISGLAWLLIRHHRTLRVLMLLSFPGVRFCHDTLTCVMAICLQGEQAHHQPSPFSAPVFPWWPMDHAPSSCIKSGQSLLLPPPHQTCTLHILLTYLRSSDPS